MILAWAVLAGLLAGLIRHGGRILNYVAAIPLRSAWLAPLAIALQVPLLRTPLVPAQEAEVQQIFFLISHLFLLAFVWRNRRLVGIQILGLGVLCNLAVIAANGGFMPITPETAVQINPGSTIAQWPVGFHYGYSKDIILSQEATRLWLLSDIIVVPSPFPWPTAFSAGDILLSVGIFILLQVPGTLARSVAVESQTA
jgi:hypothetical protein